MRFYVGVAVAALAVAVLAPSAVRAQDIKPGKWEYTTQMDMGNRPMPQIPPDKVAQMPPAMRAKIEGLMQGRTTYSACITADMPVPKNPRGGDCSVAKNGAQRRHDPLAGVVHDAEWQDQHGRGDGQLRRRRDDDGHDDPHRTRGRQIPYDAAAHQRTLPGPLRFIEFSGKTTHTPPPSRGG